MNKSKIGGLALLFVLSCSSIANAIPKFKHPLSNRYNKNVASLRTSNFFTSNFRAPSNSRLRFTIGGAVRNNDLCAIDADDKADMVALVAENALTVKSHPTMMAQMPRLSSDKKATLIVKNADESYYEEASLIIPKSGGNIELKMDESAPGIAVGEDYSWFVQVQCGDVAEVSDPVIEGSVRRVAMSETVPSSKAEKVKFYADQGIWYESLINAQELAKDGDSRYLDVLISSIK